MAFKESQKNNQARMAGGFAEVRGLTPAVRFSLPAVFSLFVHVLYGRFVNQEIGLAISGDFEAALVVPLDHAVNFLTVAEHDHHGRFRLHLLLVVEILRVGLLRWGGFPSAAAGPVISFIPFGALGTLAMFSHGGLRMIVVGAIQRRANQLTICEALRFHGPIGWKRIDCIFHGATR